MKSNPSQDPLQRDIREWSNTPEKMKGHSQPKGKGKGKGKGKRKNPGKGNHNQDQAGSPNEETGQRTLVISVFFVRELNLSVMYDFETPDRAAYVFCVQKYKSVMMDSTELPSSSTRVFQVCRGVRSQRALMKHLIIPQEGCFSPLDVEMIDQFSTLEVLCPRAQWIMRRQFRQRTSITV